MEKQKWVRPQAIVQEFVANEYVAACGDSGKVYKFECTAPKGTLYYYPQSDGEIDGKYTGTGSATRLGSYEPCSAKHEAEATDPFYDGFVDYNKDGKHSEGEGVIVWTQRGWWGNVYDAHATKNLDMNSWETAKS